jgi:phenylalanyl-tRNA synthetase beta chain
VVGILARLGFTVEIAGAGYQVQPPYWRPDVEIADDVIEDLGRVFGYDRLPATMLRGSLPPTEPRPVEDLRERLRDLAAGLGYQEVITYTLTQRDKLARVVEPGDGLRNAPLEVLNPVAAQYVCLRTSLRAGLLETYAANQRQQTGALRLFEVGFEYLPVEADLPHERPVLCAILGGTRDAVHGRHATERLDFFDARGDLEELLEALSVEPRLEPASEFGLLDGHTGAILAGRQQVGLVAQVHPGTAAAFDIEDPVFLLELWLEDLARVLPDRPPYTPPPRFPEVRQDVALLVDVALPAGRVLDIVRSHRSGGIEVRGEVFDDYRGPGVPEGKKSLALSLRFQARDRTLSDDDVTRVRNGLLARLAKEVGASLRGA